MALELNRVHQGDCLQLLQDVPPGSVQLAFADPPFNIGYDYDVYEDNRSAEEYLGWSRGWMESVSRALSDDGAFWLAIGDEFAAELKLIAQREIGLHCRSWVIWYYTFGVNCKRGFSRSHTHLFHFVKDVEKFQFHADNPAVRIPSARQLVYADRRANPKGRLPDNTWILRPQDIEDGFDETEDTWYFPRVAGTFKEREGFHGCQMPEQLLGRIIRLCSSVGDTVLDPFAGSGTTLAVAKKLGRQWLGCELSKEYAQRVEQRLDRAAHGDPLDGAADPLSSVPSTRRGKRLASKTTQGTARRKKKRAGKRRQAAVSEDDQRLVKKAFEATHDGQSVDQLLADPESNRRFVECCRQSGLQGRASAWNRSLMQLRKDGKLGQSASKSKRVLTFREMDEFSDAAEIALQLLSVDIGKSLDEILCDPSWAAQFDELAAEFAPGFTPFQYRWAALAVRKRARAARKRAEQHRHWLDEKLPRKTDLDSFKKSPPDKQSGAYIVYSRGKQPLYVGETQSFPRRIEAIRGRAAWSRLHAETICCIPAERFRYGLQSILVLRCNPLLNFGRLRAVIEPETATTCS